jgi:hypothetical protein
MKNQLYSIIIFISLLICSNSFATELNGRIKILVNDGILYRIMLQINTDSDPRALGGATITLTYDENLLGFPDQPESGVHYAFNNFHQGVYDTATVTKISANQIWINVDLLIDSLGTLVAGGPNLWTDLLMINFATNSIVTTPVVFWNVWSDYWQVYDSDNITSWDLGTFDNVTTPTIIQEEQLLVPEHYNLSQNYPNPFNPSTTIRYEIPELTYVSLIVYDMLGNEVQNLVSTEKPEGIYEVKFDAGLLSSGVYIYRLNTEKFSESRKMVVLK